MPGLLYSAPEMPGGLAKRIGKRLPFDCAEQEAHLNLILTVTVLNEGFERLFKKHGLSHSTYNVLRILRGERATGVPVLEIRRRMISRVPDVTRLVTRLEQQGLVRRTQCEKDRRVVHCHISELGLEKIARLDDQIISLHKQQLGHMSGEKLRMLSDLLEEARDPSDVVPPAPPGCPPSEG